MQDTDSSQYRSTAVAPYGYGDGAPFSPAAEAPPGVAEPRLLRPLMPVFGLGLGLGLSLGIGLGWALGAGILPGLAGGSEPAPVAAPPFAVPALPPRAVVSPAMTPPTSGAGEAARTDPETVPKTVTTPAPRAATLAPAHGRDPACGTKHACKDMTSCQEARFYLTQCGLSRLDRNGDGTPCESLCAKQ